MLLTFVLTSASVVFRVHRQLSSQVRRRRGPSLAVHHIHSLHKGMEGRCPVAMSNNLFTRGERVQHVEGHAIRSIETQKRHSWPCHYQGTRSA